MHPNYSIISVLLGCFVIAIIGTCYVKYYEFPSKNEKDKTKCCNNNENLEVLGYQVKCTNRTDFDFICNSLKIINPKMLDGENFSFDRNGDLFLNKSESIISKGK